MEEGEGGGGAAERVTIYAMCERGGNGGREHHAAGADVHGSRHHGCRSKNTETTREYERLRN